MRLLVLNPCGLFGDISIHAPQWGATRDANSCWCCGRNFNPRTPVGCDPCGRHAGGACQQISIHAPQWGATPATVEFYVATHISIHAPQWGATTRAGGWGKFSAFQSTHPSGVRPSRLCETRNASGFQSTHPSGVRPTTVGHKQYPSQNFNPRTPVGCDIRCSFSTFVFE